MTLRLGRSRLLELLKRTGKSQIDLANHLGVTPSYISQVINDKRQLSIINRKITANYLNCDSSDDLNEWR